MRIVDRTPIEKYRVRAIEPKYAAVKGSRCCDMRCLAYGIGPLSIAHDDRKRSEPTVHLFPIRNYRTVLGRDPYSIANFRGRRERTGNIKKQSTKHARAPRLQPVKANILSHLDTTLSQHLPSRPHSFPTPTCKPTRILLLSSWCR